MQPKKTGRLGRLLNHSIHGNCTTKLISIEDMPYLTLVAKKNINSDDELLYDYGERDKGAVASHPWLQSLILGKCFPLMQCNITLLVKTLVKKVFVKSTASIYIPITCNNYYTLLCLWYEIFFWFQLFFTSV